MPCQNNEELIIDPFFKQKRNGFVIDVGAADGEHYSNSRFLIEQYDWHGILIEPEPTQFAAAAKLYENNSNVKVDRHAVANRFGMMTLFCDELASTLSVQWRDMVMQRGTCKYARNTMVPVAPLTRILQDNQCPTDIDFLSIDCEGMDTEVLTTMDFKKYNVKLVCCESGHDCSTPCDLDTYLRQQGFVYLANTQVNTFWYNVCI